MQPHPWGVAAVCEPMAMQGDFNTDISLFSSEGGSSLTAEARTWVDWYCGTGGDHLWQVTITRLVHDRY